jgi:cation:H+ antiporter
VAFFSVFTDNVGITLGDIFGSNITNISLIAALFLLLSPIRQIEKKTVRNLSPILVLSAVIPFLLLVAQEGSRFIGFALLAVFAFFMYRAFKSNQADNDRQKASGSAYRQLLFFAIGIALVIISARFVVDSASSIAEFTGIRQSVLGSTIVALGTSLPELAVDLVAVRRRHLDLALGDIIGSSVTNIALVLGIVLVLSEVQVSFTVLSTLIVFVILTHAVMFLFIRFNHIRIWHSISLFAIYAAFMVVIYEIQILIGGLKF